MLPDIVLQIPVNRVSWHMETVDRLNAMETVTHHTETFFRLQLPAHRRRGQKNLTVKRRLADHLILNN